MGVVEAGSGSAGLFATLSTRITEGFPAYGTCAGLILLADRALCQKSGGQPLLGGLSATVCRNYFGAQVKSCELPLACCEGGTTPAVFIRAPAILQLHADDAEPLATVDANPCDAAAPAVREFFDRNPNPKKRKSDSSSSLASAASSECGDLITVIVAAKQRNIIVTAFHPELTNDTRWHARFLDICRQHKKKTHKFTS
ncbi:hypothetical protein CTAYLR_009604 [Chrysophaeum taylorii]|uniref:Glutaminase n=1 Tax=Chrysophaeum taylorii TaxID=2483200 RepID=A0AAD7XN47_9STRA|nr:hypothetical protein CTAYLR_009604 [Chrysophaeum taylorii]